MTHLKEIERVLNVLQDKELSTTELREALNAESSRFTRLSPVGFTSLLGRLYDAGVIAVRVVSKVVNGQAIKAILYHKVDSENG